MTRAARALRDGEHPALAATATSLDWGDPIPWRSSVYASTVPQTRARRRARLGPTRRWRGPFDFRSVPWWTPAAVLLHRRLPGAWCAPAGLRRVVRARQRRQQRPPAPTSTRAPSNSGRWSRNFSHQQDAPGTQTHESAGPTFGDDRRLKISFGVEHAYQKS